MTWAFVRGRSVSWWAELVLASVIVISVVGVVPFFIREGYLPAPFSHSAVDSFSDWHNTVYWAHNPGAYYSYKTIYPPLSYVFMHVLSVPRCYRYDLIYARSCDWMFGWVFGITYIINLVLVFKVFLKRDAATCVFRTVAVCVGLPMLFGIERGQILVQCFTFFVLAHGKIVRSARIRWIASAMAINFKPYLLFTIFTPLAKRRLLAFEGVVMAGFGVYLISFGLFGAGSPQEILQNIMDFGQQPSDVSLDMIFYNSTYKALITALSSRIPFAFYLGSQPVDFMLFAFPLAIRIGQIGVAATFLGSTIRARAVPAHRLTALAVAVGITSSIAGGYSQLLLLFLVFFERWKGFFKVSSLILAYLLCVVYEKTFVVLVHQVFDSYLSGREVGISFGFTLGSLARPAMLLMIEYLLVGASLVDLLRYKPANAWSPSAHREVDGSPVHA